MNINKFINWIQTVKIGVDGELLLSGGGGGYSPKPNTWHGGVDDSHDNTITDCISWYMKNSGRLEKEKSDVQNYFPGFKFYEEEGHIFIKGKIKANLFWGACFEVKIEYPPDFPASAPRVYVVKPSLKGYPPHVYKNGHLCLFDKKDPPERSWQPSDTAALIIAWTAKWLNCYLYWLLVTKEHRWPEFKKAINS